MNMNIQKNNIVTGKEAVAGMMRGIRYATDAIRMSYGPKGINAVVECVDYPSHMVANDAQTIIQAIQAYDPVEKRGLAFLKELMDKSNRDSGDGRKTTCIIAEEILTQGFDTDISPIELKRDLDALIPLIEEKINETKKLISTEEVSKVAAIAGESESLGKILGEIYSHIGKEGIIHLEGSGTYTTSYNFVDGVRLSGSGYLSPFMAHDEEAIKAGLKESKAVYENPTVLVTKRKISHLNDINPLLETLTKQGKKDLVIFTDDMDSGVASILVKAHKEKVLNILIIKAPVLWKNYVFEDFARITGATIVEDASGISFKNLKMEHLGTCGKIITDKDETVVMGIADIADHINMLKAQGDTDSQLRLSWLQTKTAILRLGANNESELSYLRLKAADAINSSRLALMDGVVEGGGVCLYELAYFTPGTPAGRILFKALQAPREQIVLNSGSNEVGPDVIDSAMVVKNAVRNAIALASTVLTSGIVITLPEKSAEQIAAEALQTRGMRMQP